MSNIKRYIDHNVSTKILANNLMNTILNEDSLTVMHAIEQLEDAKIILYPLEKNGYIQYDKTSGSSMYGESHSTVKEDHYLNILELICEIPKFNKYLTYILDNEELKENLINNNEFGQNPHTHFTFKEVVNFALKNDLLQKYNDDLYNILTDNFSINEILSYADIPFKKKTELEPLINADILEDVLGKLKKTSKNKIK